MRYGIIVCSKCKKAKIVQLSFKTTRCIRCNKIINIDKVRILKKSNSENELRNEIGKINAELYGDRK